MYRLAALVLCLAPAVAPAQTPLQVREDHYQTDVVWVGEDGRTFTAPQNVLHMTIRAPSGAVVFSWGGVPVVGTPAGSFVSTYEDAVTVFRGTYAAVRYKDLKIYTTSN